MFKATGVLRNDKSEKRRTVIFNGDRLSGDKMLMDEIMLFSMERKSIDGYQPDGPLHTDPISLSMIIGELCTNTVFTGDVPKIESEDGVDY